MQVMHHYQIMLDLYKRALEQWKKYDGALLIQEPLLVSGDEVKDYRSPSAWSWLPEGLEDTPLFLLVNDNCDGLWSDWVRDHFPHVKYHCSQEMYDWVEQARKEEVDAHI